MNDKYLNYISLQHMTKYCPRTFSGESVQGHFYQGKCPRTLLSGESVRGHYFSEESVRGHYPLKVSADKLCQASWMVPKA